jgi:hypothetical protein
MSRMTSRHGSPHRYRRRLALLLGAVALAVAPSRAVAQSAAQAAPANAGLWYEVTLGGAGSRLACSICSAHRDLGAVITGALGAYASPKLRVGLELSRWTYRDVGVREMTSGIGLVAHMKPSARSRLYLLGGAGWTSYRASDYTFGAPRASVGIGYDVPLAGAWVAGNVLTMDLAAFGKLRNESVTVVDNVGLSAIRMAVQLRRR